MHIGHIWLLWEAILARYLKDLHQDDVFKLLAEKSSEFSLTEGARRYIVTQRSIDLDGFGFQYAGDPTSNENQDFFNKVTYIFEKTGINKLNPD